MYQPKIHLVILWAAGAHTKCGRIVKSDAVTAYPKDVTCKLCKEPK